MNSELPPTVALPESRDMQRPAAGKLARLYEALAVTKEQALEVPRISHMFRRIGGVKKVVEYLRASEDPMARRILQQIDTLPKKAITEIPFEAFCVAAEVSTKTAFAIIAAEIFEQSRNESLLLAAKQHPDVVQYTVDQALTPAGSQERKMLHQHAHFLPVPKTAVTNVFGNQSIDARSQTNTLAILPPLEAAVKRMSDRFNAQAKTVTPVVDVLPGEDDDDGDDE